MDFPMGFELSEAAKGGRTELADELVIDHYLLLGTKHNG
jgi:hypothetical protein